MLRRMPQVVPPIWAARAGSLPGAAGAGAWLLTFAALVVRHARVEDERARHEAARVINVRALARLAREWAALPDVAPTQDAHLDRHPYARDLDLFGHASVAQWLLGTSRANAPYVASQGAALGRSGRLHVSQDEEGTIWVGGGTVTCVSGQVEL